MFVCMCAHLHVHALCVPEGLHVCLSTFLCPGLAFLGQ